MGRRPEWMKKQHVTVQSILKDKRHIPRAIADPVGQLKRKSEWPDLDVDQMSVLVYYSMSKNWEKAAKQAKKDLAWVNEQKENYDFQVAARLVIEKPKKFAQKLAESLLPYTVQLMLDNLQNDPTNHTELNAGLLKLKVITQLQKIGGLQKQPDVTLANMVQRVSINTNFQKPLPSKETIEAEGYIVDGHTI